MNNQQIVNEIVMYIQNNGNNFLNWYVGIASDPRIRLFNDHCVQEKGGCWIFRSSLSSEDARIIENYIIDKYHTKGDIGGGSENSNFVYAYKITESTKQ